MIAFVLNGLFLSAQTSKHYLTATPSAYPDTVNKATIIIADTQQNKSVQQNNISYETKTATPETKISIGKASAVSTTDKSHSTPSVIDTLHYKEIKTNAESAPVNNSAVQPR